MNSRTLCILLLVALATACAVLLHDRITNITYKHKFEEKCAESDALYDALTAYNMTLFLLQDYNLLNDPLKFLETKLRRSIVKMNGRTIATASYDMVFSLEKPPTFRQAQKLAYLPTELKTCPPRNSVLLGEKITAEKISFNIRGIDAIHEETMARYKPLVRTMDLSVLQEAMKNAANSPDRNKPSTP